jgi:hypothetical protein
MTARFRLEAFIEHFATDEPGARTPPVVECADINLDSYPATQPMMGIMN